MTPPPRNKISQEYGPGVPFDLERVARLEERLGHNGEDVEELREKLRKAEEAQSGIRAKVTEVERRMLDEIGGLRSFIAEKFGEMKGYAAAKSESKGDWKWLIGVVVALAAFVYSLVKR